MKLTDQEVSDYKQFILEAEYALMKQIESSQPMGGYGEIELLMDEKENYDAFLTEMMNKRIAKLTKILKDYQ